jgi:uncharacterized protein (TIGR02147 family)
MTPNRETPVRIYDYTDYRKYLFDYYTDQKKRNSFFSYRYFAKKAEINSVGLYKDIIEGRQCLGRSLIIKFAKALKLEKRETEYFENMVYFNEAKTIEERKIYFERMAACYDSKAHKIDHTRYKYYSRWYYSAIRAILSYYRFNGDYATLAKMLSPPIRTEQARDAVRVLEKLGFIVKDDHGAYELVENVITTGVLSSEPKLEILNVINFQKTMMKIANEAYDRHDSGKLSMSTLTLSVSGETYAAIKDEISALRKKIAALAQRDTRPDRVYQLNYQLYPLTGSQNKNKDTL